MPALVTLGDCCIDYYLPPIALGFAGGSAPNVAVAACAAGIPAGCAGAVGSDRAGQAMLQLLDANGVDTIQVAPRPGQTRRVPLRVTPHGHQFAHELMPPRQPFQPTPEMLDYARAAELVHLNWVDDPLAALPALTAPGGPLLSLDYGFWGADSPLWPTLSSVQIAFFALPATRASPATRNADAEALAHTAAQQGAALVIITLGEAGCLAFDGAKLIRQPATSVVAVADALGAGDSFIGAFLSAHLRGLQLPLCLDFATFAAANTCTHAGSWPGAELDPLLLPPEENPW